MSYLDEDDVAQAREDEDDKNLADYEDSELERQAEPDYEEEDN